MEIYRISADEYNSIEKYYRIVKPIYDIDLYSNEFEIK